MERLRENKFLMYAILASSAIVVALSLGLSEDLSNTFEIVEFPDEVNYQIHVKSNTITNMHTNTFIFSFQFKKILVGVLVADTVLAFAVDRISSFVFGSVRKTDSEF